MKTQTKSFLSATTLLALLLALLSWSASPARCADASATEEKSIEIEGSAPIDKDEAAAKKAAIDDALLHATRQVVPEVSDISQARSYVKVYRVEEDSVDNGRYTVKLLVTVLSNPNVDDTRKLLRWSGNPRIMVVIPETFLGRPHVPDPAGETELVSRLREAKLRVIESSEVARIRYDEDMGRIVKESDIKAMKDFGAKYQCDILIAGEAFAEGPNPAPGGFVSARARIEAKAFIADTGEIIASGDGEAGGADISPAVAGKTALRNAATVLARSFVPQIRDAIVGGNRTITLKITSLYSASQLDALEAALKKAANVQSVQRRNFDAAAGTATLDVETILMTAQLSKELLDIREPLLSVKTSTGQEMEIEVLRR